MVRSRRASRPPLLAAPRPLSTPTRRFACLAHRRRRVSLFKRQATRTRDDEGAKTKAKGTCEARGERRGKSSAHDAAYTTRPRALSCINTNVRTLDEHVSTTSARQARDKGLERAEISTRQKTQSRPCAPRCSSSCAKAKDATRDTPRACEGQGVVERAARGPRGGVADLWSTSPALKKRATRPVGGQ